VVVPEGLTARLPEAATMDPFRVTAVAFEVDHVRVALPPKAMVPAELVKLPMLTAGTMLMVVVAELGVVVLEGPVTFSFTV
jgi:hypothetical protein